MSAEELESSTTACLRRGRWAEGRLSPWTPELGPGHSWLIDCLLCVECTGSHSSKFLVRQTYWVLWGNSSWDEGFVSRP